MREAGGACREGVGAAGWSLAGPEALVEALAGVLEGGVTDCRLGVLAFGDSITNGGGELQWGVALQSWALWVARALGLRYSPYAVDGATARDVVAEQIPAWRARSAPARATTSAACTSASTTCARLDWDPAAYARDLAAASRSCATPASACCCRRSRSTSAARARARRSRRPTRDRARGAREHGALVVDLRDFGARNHVMVDHVHPTAFGQVAIAERALGCSPPTAWPSRVRPSQLIALGRDPLAAPARRRDLRLPPREGQRAGGAIAGRRA